jgi:hypothetical protein
MFLKICIVLNDICLSRSDSCIRDKAARSAWPKNWLNAFNGGGCVLPKGSSFTLVRITFELQHFQLEEAQTCR